MKTLAYTPTGELIRRARNNAGLSVAELAEKLGMSASGLRNYENGYRIPDNNTLIKIANILHINIHSLIERPYMGIEGFINIFQMAEKIYGLRPIEKDGQVVLAIDDPSFKEGDEQKYIMQEMLRDWKIIYDKYKSGEITDDEYILYKYKYPYHHSQLPENITSDCSGKKYISQLLTEVQQEAFLLTSAPSANQIKNAIDLTPGQTETNIVTKDGSITIKKTAKKTIVGRVKK